MAKQIRWTIEVAVPEGRDPQELADRLLDRFNGAAEAEGTTMVAYAARADDDEDDEDEETAQSMWAAS